MEGRIKRNTFFSLAGSASRVLNGLRFLKAAFNRWKRCSASFRSAPPSHPRRRARAIRVKASMIARTLYPIPFTPRTWEKAGERPHTPEKSKRTLIQAKALIIVLFDKSRIWSKARFKFDEMYSTFQQSNLDLNRLSKPLHIIQSIRNCQVPLNHVQTISNYSTIIKKIVMRLTLKFRRGYNLNS